jgi:1-acyl-sn-glycerol-3-phosphate acyltransferase
MTDRTGVRLYQRATAAIARFGLSAMARVRVEGLEHVPTRGPLIVVANHMSNADPPLLWGWLVPALGRVPTYLAKAVLFRGVAGPVLRAYGATPVEAGGSDMAAYRVAKATLDAGGVVTLMPEGTRSLDGTLRFGVPFTLRLEGRDRRAALATADAEIMRRIAALVEPRHRGDWEPWPGDPS